MTTTPQQIGPYRIQTEIGRGGMAVVYRAVDTRSGDVVALKVLPPHLAQDERYLQRFEREGKSAARLRHPNIVRTLETGSAGEYHYLAMQYVEGQTLAELLRTQRTLLPVAEVVEIIRQIASALDYAHDLGVLHRDIKTSNIMIDKQGVALLMDFGVAKLVDEDHTAYTIVGTTVGTPAFMAPEQARGNEVDRRADIYSLGVIAYSLFTGVMPFKADSQPALLHKIVYEPPIQPEEVNRTLPPGIIYALKKVLAKSPSARYASAGEFAQALAKGISWTPSSGELRVVQDRMLVTTGSQHLATVAKQPRQGASGSILLGLGALVAAMAALFLFFNPPAWLADGSDSPNDAAAAAAPETIALRNFRARDNSFRLDIPTTWRPGSATYPDGVIYTFDAPDHMARIFATRLAKLAGRSSNLVARAAVEEFLSTGDLPYTNVVVQSDSAVQESGDRNSYEQMASADWMGQPVVLHINVIHGAASSYLVGMAVESAQDPVFEPLRKAVVNSIQIDLAPMAQFDEGTPSLPVENSGALQHVLGATPEPDIATPTPRVAAAIDRKEEATAVPFLDLPTVTNTPDQASATPLTELIPAATETPVEEAATDVPLIATEEPTPSPTELPTATTTDTPTLKPTATALPTNTQTPTVTPDIAATRTVEAREAETAAAPPPSATRTPTATHTATPAPTATTTPTPTATPNLAATQTVAMQLLQTSVSETLTAIAPRFTDTPLATRTPTLRPTATPVATATSTPTRVPSPTPTDTPTPDLAATKTADARRLATALAQTLTALPTATAISTSTQTPKPAPTATPTPSIDPLDVTLTVIAATLESVQGTSTPTATLDPLDVTLTAIAVTLEAAEGGNPPSP